MKTIDLETLRAKKENLQSSFDRVKEEAVKCERAIESLQAKRAGFLEQMSQLQGAHKTVVELEQSIADVAGE